MPLLMPIVLTAITAAVLPPPDTAQPLLDSVFVAQKSALLDSANNLAEKHEYDQAAAIYRAIVSAAKDIPVELWGKAQFNLGYVLQKQTKYLNAIAAYRELFPSKVDDQEPGAHIMETNRAYRHRACLQISNCYERLCEPCSALVQARLARDKYIYRSWCGTCQMGEDRSLFLRILKLWVFCHWPWVAGIAIVVLGFAGIFVRQRALNMRRKRLLALSTLEAGVADGASMAVGQPVRFTTLRIVLVFVLALPISVIAGGLLPISLLGILLGLAGSYGAFVATGAVLLLADAVLFFLTPGIINGNLFCRHLVRRQHGSHAGDDNVFVVQAKFFPRVHGGFRGFLDDADDVGILEVSRRSLVFTGDHIRFELPCAAVVRVCTEGIPTRGKWANGDTVRVETRALGGFSWVDLTERSGITIQQAHKRTRQLFAAVWEAMHGSVDGQVTS